MRRSVLALLIVGGVAGAGCGEPTQEPLRSPLDSGSAAPPPKSFKSFGTGQNYSCPSSAMTAIDPAASRAYVRIRRARSLKRTLNRLDRRYPQKAVPEAIAERYNAVLRDYNIFARQANVAINRYNGLLRSECEKD